MLSGRGKYAPLNKIHHDPQNTSTNGIHMQQPHAALPSAPPPLHAVRLQTCHTLLQQTLQWLSVAAICPLVHTTAQPECRRAPLSLEALDLHMCVCFLTPSLHP
jgi:hypothetical protein